MPKVLNTGDWQLDAYPAHDKLDELGRSIRFKENVEAIRRMLKQAWDLGCRVMVHNGDLTEHKNPKSTEIKGAAELFRYWIDLGGTIVAAAGNHDGATYSVSSSSFEGLAIMAGSAFRVAHEVTYYEDLNLVVLPYLHNKSLAQVQDAHATVRRKIKGPKAPWLVAHYGVQNCVVGAYNLTIPSDMLGAEQVFPDGLPYGAVFCGHIHKQQVVPMMNGSDPVDIVFPGSPFPVDFGERNDPKGFAIYDTETNRYELHQMVPDREWVQVVLDPSKPADECWTPPTWSAGAILKFSGKFTGKVHPRLQFAKCMREGLVPLPFCFPDFKEVKPVGESRVSRGAEYSKITSLREAAAAYVRDRFKDKPEETLKMILGLVTDAVEDLNKAAFAPFLYPVHIGAKNFKTYKEIDYMFEPETPTLLVGANGVGKTNFMEALLFAVTGLTAKKSKITALLRRGAKDGFVRLVLMDREGNSFIITRTLKRTAQGVTHKVTVDVDTPGTGVTSWTDGGVKEVQDNLNKSLCVPFELVRTVNFMFQRWHDPEAFVQIEPLARKKILSEILGLAPLVQAFKRLTETRQEAARALEAERNKLVGMTSIFDPEARVQLVKQVEEAGVLKAQAVEVLGLRATELQAVDSRVKAQEMALDEARKAIQALPDTAAALASAQTALGSENASYERRYPELKERWRALDGEVTTLADRVAKSNVSHWETRLKQAQDALAGEEQHLQRQAGALGTAEAELKAKGQEQTKLVNELTALQQNNITHCPTCRQPVDSTHVRQEIERVTKAQSDLVPVLAALQQRVTELKAERQQSEGRKATYAGEVRNAQSILDDDRARLQLFEQKKQALAQCIQDGKKLNTDHETAVRTLTENIKVAQAAEDANRAQREKLQAVEAQEASNLRGLREAQDSARQAHGRAETAVQTAEQSLKFANDKLAKHDETAELIKAAEQSVAAAQAKHELLVLACEALDPKTGLPIYLVDSRLQFLEERMNDYMAILGRPDLRLQLTTQDGDKETLAILVDDGNEERLDVREYSGGEGIRMELAIKLALADLVADSRECYLGMFFLDEPESGLEASGKQALVDLLHDRARSGWPSVVIITHDERLQGSFSRRMTAEVGLDKETVLVAR